MNPTWSRPGTRTSEFRVHGAPVVPISMPFSKVQGPGSFFHVSFAPRRSVNDARLVEKTPDPRGVWAVKTFGFGLYENLRLAPSEEKRGTWSGACRLTIYCI